MCVCIYIIEHILEDNSLQAGSISYRWMNAFSKDVWWFYYPC